MRKLCTDCIYCNKTPKDSTLWKCTYGAEVNLVDGLPEIKYCNLERSRSGDYLCGPEGKFFESGERF